MAKKKKAAASKAWFKPRFTGQRLCFTGKPGGYGDSRADFESWARDEGAEIEKTINDKVDQLVVLEKGATAGTVKKAAALNNKGAAIVTISESDFREAFVPDEDEIVALVAAGDLGRQRLQELFQRSHSYYYGKGESIDLTSTNLRGADLVDLNLRPVKLDGADLRESHLKTLETGILRSVRMDKAHGEHFRPSGMTNCSCKAANLPHMFVGYQTYGNKQDLSDCDFTGANLDDSYFGYVKVIRTTFKRAILTEADFPSASLTEVDFTSADLSQSELTNVTIKDSAFTRAKLCQVKLSHSTLTNVNCRNADFTGASLNGTVFKDVDLTGAKFGDTLLFGTKFEGTTDISKAKGLQLPTITAVKTGKACRDLSAIVNKADAISITGAVQLKSGVVQIEIDKGNYYRSDFVSKFSIEIDGSTISDTTYLKTFTNALKHAGENWGHGELRFETIKVKSSKSAVKGKALQEAVIAALAEVFDTDIPSDDDLKAAKKKSQAKSDQIKQDLLDEIRGGKAGVAAFNARDNQVLVDKKQNQLRNEDFSSAKLAGLSAESFDFQGSKFNSAALRKADLQWAKLKKTDFSAADLRDANLKGAVATEATFSLAKLQKANLEWCTLDKANFEGADLTGANLADASLKGTQFANAKLKDVTWEDNVFDEKTAFPNGFEIPETLKFAGIGIDPRIAEALPSIDEEVIDFDSFMDRLKLTVDKSRLSKSMKMLKADRFELFSEVSDEAFRGVVKSQTDASLVYSCQLTSAGEFTCCTQNLNPCGGLRGALCKHLLVLIVGLTKGGMLDANKAATWAHTSLGKKPELDKDQMSEVLLKYKGAEAGEVDWRPMETIPEDYYAF
ncbi:pentapeptide repeat-containing protein [Stieleria sp. JC731]|uniref:pentapeptide repeat-containing protein n=1 Tax=Pirellulaceae TaxID=2691357 RepID=UPI001E3F0297|nr:pentapeptide repeat-containing protein [Stieleria sp. JC731]MCC9600280.1 pentapeptide repeat-containing protein [Stieleria sp. JC731]